MINPEQHANNDRQIGMWLMVIVALVALMVVVGGATRLTDSGLSITEWKPVTGIMPPLSQSHWDSEFEKYKEIPEYALVNSGMTLDDFKGIYYWEWGHRFLGRMIGFAFALPMIWFMARGQVRRSLVPRLIGLFVLGGLQGVMGWYMVMSGLADRVDVSQYRLAAHLGLAVLILTATLWVALGLIQPRKWQGALRDQSPVALAAIGVTALVVLQMLLGAFVAGIHAGKIYNTWPLMEGALVPSGLMAMSPWYLNFFESHLTVQFDHRMVGYLVFFAIVGLVGWIERQKLEPSIRAAARLLAGAVTLQMGLGIAALLSVVPLSLGLLHQAGALVVLLASIYLLHRLANST